MFILYLIINVSFYILIIIAASLNQFIPKKHTFPTNLLIHPFHIINKVIHNKKQTFADFFPFWLNYTHFY